MSQIFVLSVGLDPPLLEMRNLVLRSAEYIVESAPSVKVAVARFLAGDFDLVVLCHSIPTVERDRLTCLIRASGSRTPVVSISGSLGQHDAFADATLEDSPSKFFGGIEEVLAKAARIPAAWVGKHRAKPVGTMEPAERPRVSNTVCEDPHQEEKPRKENL